MSTDTRLIVYLEGKPLSLAEETGQDTNRCKLVVRGPTWLKQRGLGWGTDRKYSQSELARLQPWKVEASVIL